MNLAHASRLTVFAIVAVAWLIVFATPEYGVVWILLGAGVLTAAWRSGGRWLQGRRARSVWRATAFIMLLVFPIDLVFFAPRIVHGMLHVALVAQALLLFEVSNARMHRLLILLSLFNLLAATQFTQSLLFAPLFMLYAALAVAALTFLHLLEAAGRTAVEAPLPRLRAGRSLVYAMGLATVAVLPIVVALFLLLPRYEYSLMAQSLSTDDAVNRLQELERARKQTGFNDQVELGDYGRVQEDPTVVLRVKFPRGVPEALQGAPMFWRAGALNQYDGWSWSTSREEFPLYVGTQRNVQDRRAWARAQGRGRIPPTFGTTFLIGPYFQNRDRKSLEALRTDPELIEQEVFLELPYTDSLVGLQSVVAVDGFFPRGLSVDANGSLRVESRTLLAERISYTAFSYLPETDTTQLGGVDPSEYQPLREHPYFGPYFAAMYLQLPANLSPEVRQLVAQLIEGKATLDEQIQALEAHFADFTYSLDTQGTAFSAAPLDEFLFTTRQGYCEHFATAMVLMLRVAGMPARLANGFKGGVWNAPGEFYAVRQADAHTWAEVWVPRHGWVPVDPVPGAYRGLNLEPWIVPEPNTYLAYAQAFWQEEVLGYNTTTQTRLAARIGSWLRDRPSSIWKWVRRAFAATTDFLAQVLLWLVRWAVLVAPATALVVFGVVFIWRYGLPGGTLPVPGGGPRVPFYLEMLRLLRRAGLEKRDTEPPRAFAAQVASRRPDMASQVDTLTRLYERVRFGAEGLTRAELVAVRGMLNELRRSHRRPAVAAPGR